MSTQEKTDLLTKLDQKRAKTLASFKEIDSGTLIYPDGGWTLTDIINHLTVWEEVTNKAMELFLAGKELSAPFPITAFDAFNNRTVQERKHLSSEAAYAAWEAAREKMKALVVEITAEQSETEFAYPWGERGNVGQVVRGLIWHENEHWEDVLAVVGSR